MLNVLRHMVVLFLVSAIGSWSASFAADMPRRPNVILLITDDKHGQDGVDALNMREIRGSGEKMVRS